MLVDDIKRKKKRKHEASVESHDKGNLSLPLLTEVTLKTISNGEDKHLSESKENNEQDHRKKRKKKQKALLRNQTPNAGASERNNPDMMKDADALLVNGPEVKSKPSKAERRAARASKAERRAARKLARANSITSPVLDAHSRSNGGDTRIRPIKEKDFSTLSVLPEATDELLLRSKKKTDSTGNKIRTQQDLSTDCSGASQVLEANASAPSMMTDSRIEKLEKAITKYLKREDISASNFATSLDLVQFDKSRYYRFIKKYFASSKLDDLKSMTRLIVSKISGARAPGAIAANQRGKKIITIPRSSSQDQPAIVGASSTSDGAEITLSPKTYSTGPLTSLEQDKISAAVTSYCERQDITRQTFCERLHGLPVPLGRHQKRELYKEFYDILPDRKSKSVQDYLQRAYIPYERSKFSSEDDTLLTKLRAEKGADWLAIGKAMGRFSHDVRDRYRNHLQQPDTKLGEWSAAERDKFRTIINQYERRDDMNWTTIADQMGSRSRAQCRDRFFRLQGGRAGLHDKSHVEFAHLPVVTMRSAEQPKPGSSPGSGSMSSRPKKGATILPGDVLHLLKLVQKSKVKSLKEGADAGIFSRYDGVFSTEQILTCLNQRLETGSQSFRSTLKRVIAEFSGTSQNHLSRTLVSDSDDG